MDKYEIVIRVLLAVLVGGAIGYERESQHRPAGFRTHILVCVGAAVASMIQLNIMYETVRLIKENPVLASSLNTDLSRIGAQVITGIGFLGAGTIIREKGFVKGLTTAASIWVVACIGLAVGLGYYFLTITSTIAVVFILILLKKVEEWLMEKRNTVILKVTYKNEFNTMDSLTIFFKNRNMRIKHVELWEDDNSNEENQRFKVCTYKIFIADYDRSKLLQEVLKFEGVVNVRLL